MIVTAIRAYPHQVERLEIDVAESITVGQLREQLGWGEPFTAIFGDRVTADHQLRAGDRVEFLRALTVDPKESRRQRAANNPLPRTHRQPKRQRAPQTKS